MIRRSCYCDVAVLMMVSTETEECGYRPLKYCKDDGDLARRINAGHNLVLQQLKDSGKFPTISDFTATVEYSDERVEFCFESSDRLISTPNLLEAVQFIIEAYNDLYKVTQGEYGLMFLDPENSYVEDLDALAFTFVEDANFGEQNSYFGNKYGAYTEDTTGLRVYLTDF